LKIWFVFLVSIFALLLSHLAEAQMTMDIAKITCKQYLFDRTISPEAPSIATWLSGYFNGRRNNTTIDIGTMRTKKIRLRITAG